MIDPEEHSENRGVVENILRRIPGFAGYLSKENRRASDQLARQWLSDRLQQAKRNLDDYARGLAEAAQIDELPQVDRLRGRVDRLIARLRGAPAGYSGFFDLVQVDDELLEKVYDHDVRLIEEVDQLAMALESAGGNQQPPSQIVPKMLEEADKVSKKIDQRENLLKGVGPF